MDVSHSFPLLGNLESQEQDGIVTLELESIKIASSSSRVL